MRNEDFFQRKKRLNVILIIKYDTLILRDTIDNRGFLQVKLLSKNCQILYNKVDH